jgi:hypothetical protein
MEQSLFWQFYEVAVFVDNASKESKVMPYAGHSFEQ